MDNCDKTEISLKRGLARLVKKKEIVSLRRGFYLIIPPRYSKLGQLPIQLYVDKLFKHLKRPYYLGLYSAARFHGAGHQQIQRDYVVTDTSSLSDIKKMDIDVRFFGTSNWSNKNIINKKSDAGIFKISSPALTVADLIHHQNKLGGLNRMVANIEELLEEIQADKSLSEQILKHLQQSKYYPVLLSSRSKLRAGAVNNRWKIDVNIKLESDL